MPHKWWKVPRCNYLYHLCLIGIWRIKCQRSSVSEKSWWGCCNIYQPTSKSRCNKPQPTSASWINFSAVSVMDTISAWWERKLSCTSQWGWNNLGKLQVEIWWKRWGSGTDQCLKLTPCCHCAERKCQGLSQCDTVSFLCGKGKVPALKKPQYSCTKWGTGGTWCHRKWLDGYRSDIFFISLLREYIVNCTGTTSIAKNLLHWIPCPPPPPRNINLDLKNRRARHQMWKALAPYVSQIKSNSRDRQL